MSLFEYNLAVSANQYNIDEDHMPAFGKCKLEISYTKTSGTPTFALSVGKMPRCGSTGIKGKVTCQNSIISMQKSLQSVWYQSFLVDENTAELSAHKGKLYIGAYSADNAVFSIAVEGQKGTLPYCDVFETERWIVRPTTGYPYCDIDEGTDTLAV